VVISLIDDDFVGSNNNNNNSNPSFISPRLENSNTNNSRPLPLSRKFSDYAIVIVDDDDVDISVDKVETVNTAKSEKEIEAVGNVARPSIFTEATLVKPAGEKFYHRSHLLL
jgi:hypothetical protein